MGMNKKRHIECLLRSDDGVDTRVDAAYNGISRLTSR